MNKECHLLSLGGEGGVVAVLHGLDVHAHGDAVGEVGGGERERG